MRDTFLIKQPWITEKSVILNEAGQYVFVVQPGATKNEVKKAIELEYKVKVASVNMVVTAPKKRRFRGMRAMKPGFKKAIVSLKAGEKIDFTR